ncbi:zf-DHHC-domain-containing protein [Rhodotorula sp. JG-1b]|nr:zf-DHHC-domain-containing protein [Rhodotorula sp. JG-1b]
MTTAATGAESSFKRPIDSNREKRGPPLSADMSLPDKLAPSYHAESTTGAPSTSQDTAVHHLSSQNRPAEQPVRNYRLHQGTNRFFLDGRCMTSGDSVLPLVGSSIVAVLLPALFWPFNGPWLWNHLGAGGGGGKATVFVFLVLVLLMWSSMARTALSDPGIIPRNLDPDPPQRFIEPDPDVPGSEGEWIVEVKYIELPGKGYVASKWCPTCHTYRPPRTSHCRLCDNCVERTDHHCAFLNNCIGRRNYRPFIVFLTSAVVCAVYALAFTLYHIVHALTEADSTGWRWDTIGAVVTAVLAVVFVTPIAGLLGYHIRLMWSNRTTIELLRPAALRGSLMDPSTGLPLLPEEGGAENPWKRSNPLLNMKDALGAPRRQSKLAREGRVQWRGWSTVPVPEAARGSPTVLLNRTYTSL